MMNNLSNTKENKQLEEVTGCITTHQIYPHDRWSSGVHLTLENISRTYQVLLKESAPKLLLQRSEILAVNMTLTYENGWYTTSLQDISLLQSPASLAHLPHRRIADARQVNAVEAWLEGCPYQMLQDFVRRVLGRADIGTAFFSLPASRNHHHCQPGGLAEHSLDVAERTYRSTAGFEEHERWLAAVCGLLHDIGKVRTYTSVGDLTSLGRLISHEILTFEVLADALSILQRQWSDGAIAVRYILEWTISPRSKRPLLPVAMAVKSADCMSAAMSSRSLAFEGHPDWHQFATHSIAGPTNRFWLPRTC